MSNQICSTCDTIGGFACCNCGEWIEQNNAHNCSEEMTMKERLMKVIEILKTPEDSDDIWWCVGELEEIVKTLNSERIGK